MQISRFSHGHTFVCGITRSGKTEFAKKLMAAWEGAAVFINTQGEKSPFLKGNRYSSLRSLLSALRRGAKVDYTPSPDDALALAEIQCLIPYFMDLGCRGGGLLVVIDEAHVYGAQGMRDSPLFRISRRGLKYGVTGVFVSQRPADVDKRIVTQCVRHVIFSTSFEGPYFRRYGIPGEELQKKLSAAGPYHYVVYEGGLLSGPFYEKI